MERGASRADVHCAPKDVATGNIFSIDAKGPVTGGITERQLAQKRWVRVELFLGRPPFFFVRLCRGKVVGKQPATRRFQKVSRPRRSARDANVERPAFSAVNR